MLHLMHFLEWRSIRPTANWDQPVRLRLILILGVPRVLQVLNKALETDHSQLIKEPQVFWAHEDLL